MTELGANNRVFYAISVILIAMLAMSFQSIGMKYVSPDMTLWQITICRSALILGGLFPFLFIAWQKGELRIQNARWVWVRAVLMAIMNLLYYGALPLMTIAVVSTASYTSPIFVSVMAALILKEKINFIGGVSIALAFIGTLFVVQPGGTDFNVFVVFPLLSAITYGSAHIITRLKCQNVSATLMVLTVHLAFLTVAMAAQLLLTVFPSEVRSVVDYNYITGDWAPMTPRIWAFTIGFAVLNGVTQLGFAKAYQAAPSSVVSPWEYSYLLFVSSLSFLVFGEVPNLYTIVGMVMIVLAGVAIIFSETILKAFNLQGAA